MRPKPQDGETQRRSSPTTPRPVGDPLANFLDRLNPVAAFVDDARCKFHAFRHVLEGIALEILKEIFDLESSDIDHTLESLQDLHPRGAMQRVGDRPAAQVAVAKVQRPFRLHALETGRDQVGRLLRRHHSHIDLGAEDRRVELHVRTAFVGHRAQLAVDDLGDRRHLRRDRIELIAAQQRQPHKARPRLPCARRPADPSPAGTPPDSRAHPAR